MRHASSLCTIAAALGWLALAQPAAAESCLRLSVSATGSPAMWNQEESAKRSAITAWPGAASQQAGPDYASWALARGKNVSCALVSKSTVRCTATATPCKP